MVSMSNLDIAMYLREYADVQSEYARTGNEEFVNIHRKIYKDRNDESLCYAIRTYLMYILMKRFSMIEDYFLNRDNLIDNNNLNGFVHNCKFYEKPNNISNKRILEIVRNAFNHNDGEMFKMSKNGRYCEINISDTRYPRQIARGGNPEPLHMRFDSSYIFDLCNLIHNEGQNILFYGINLPEGFDIKNPNLDDVEFEHYYFNHKMDKNDVNVFKNISLSENMTKEEAMNKSRALHALGDSINLSTKYKFDEDQKEKAKDTLKKFIDLNPLLSLEQDPDNIMTFILSDVIPIPLLRSVMIDQQLAYIQLVNNYNKSCSDLLKMVAKSIDEPSTIPELQNEKNTRRMDLLRHMATGDFVQFFPYIMYIDYVVTQLCTDEEIIIDGVTYDKDRIRNSFAHGRWYLGTNETIKLFDASPENKNDYNLNNLGSVNIRSFIKWADEQVSFKKAKELAQKYMQEHPYVPKLMI